jgi:phenylacetate-CoA ligase
MHIQEDHFYAEVIDPESGTILGPGMKGELVLSTLTKEAFPVIRFRTGDICSITDEPCACGRTTRRISRIYGRYDDMLVIKGINIIPDRIGDILQQIRGERPVFQLVAVRHGRQDQLEIWVEVTEQFFYDEMREQRTPVDLMSKKIANFIGITTKIKLVERGSLKRNDDRVKPFVDCRLEMTMEDI